MFDTVWRAGWAAVFAGALAGCAVPAPVVKPQPKVEEIAPDAGPRSALEAFLRAKQAGHFDAAYDMLAAPLRARYTPERLKLDYQRDHALADDVLARVKAALASGAPFQLSPGRADLVLGTNRATHLVKEGGAWKVAALE